VLALGVPGACAEDRAIDLAALDNAALDNAALGNALGNAPLDNAPLDNAPLDQAAVDKAGLAAAIRQLAKLDRYERRARARRRLATRALTDHLVEAVQRRGLAALRSAAG
jgi:hypothetical protein